MEIKLPLFFALLAIVPPLTAVAQTPVAPIQTPISLFAKAKPTRTVVYKTTTNGAGEKVELTLNIFEPTNHKATDKTPAIALFFGGGWLNGSPNSLFPHCAYFASRGMVAFAPDYRVKSRHQTTPFESVADGKSAIRYLRVHAAELGIDPNRIAAGGSSAGGHVAATAGIIPGLDEKTEDAAISSVPNALVLFNPVVDTSPAGYGNERLTERWKEISPLQAVRAGLPPTIVVHGTADKIVPYANAAAFEKAMKEAGNRVELLTLEGEGHGLVPDIKKKTATVAMRAADVFLASLGYLQGEPTMPPFAEQQ
jgi:acetyl esterase